MQYERLWRNKFLTLDALTIDDFIDTFEARLAELKEWKEARIRLDPESGITDDYAVFITENAAVAKKYGFKEDNWQDDFWSTEEDWQSELEQEYQNLLATGLSEAEAQDTIWGSECRTCENCHCREEKE